MNTTTARLFKKKKEKVWKKNVWCRWKATTRQLSLMLFWVFSVFCFMRVRPTYLFANQLLGWWISSIYSFVIKDKKWKKLKSFRRNRETIDFYFSFFLPLYLTKKIGPWCHQKKDNETCIQMKGERKKKQEGNSFIQIFFYQYFLCGVNLWVILKQLVLLPLDVY